MIVQALAGPPDPRGRRGRCFLLLDPESRQVVVVDPPIDWRGIRAFLDAHGAGLAVVATTGSSSGARKTARDTTEAFQARWFTPATAPAPAPAGGRDTLSFGRHTLHLHTAADGDAALLVGPGCLFTGSALLAGEIPPEEEPARFRARASWLRQVLGELPARTRIYPGRGPVSEVGLERTCNQELWG